MGLVVNRNIYYSTFCRGKDKISGDMQSKGFHPCLDFVVMTIVVVVVVVVVGVDGGDSIIVGSDIGIDIGIVVETVVTVAGCIIGDFLTVHGAIWRSMTQQCTDPRKRCRVEMPCGKGGLK